MYHPTQVWEREADGHHKRTRRSERVLYDEGIVDRDFDQLLSMTFSDGDAGGGAGRGAGEPPGGSGSPVSGGAGVPSSSGSPGGGPRSRAASEKPIISKALVHPRLPPERPGVPVLRPMRMSCGVANSSSRSTRRW